MIHTSSSEKCCATSAAVNGPMCLSFAPGFLSAVAACNEMSKASCIRPRRERGHRRAVDLAWAPACMYAPAYRAGWRYWRKEVPTATLAGMVNIRENTSYPQKGPIPLSVPLPLPLSLCLPLEFFPIISFSSYMNTSGKRSVDRALENPNSCEPLIATATLTS